VFQNTNLHIGGVINENLYPKKAHFDNFDDLFDNTDVMNSLTSFDNTWKSMKEFLPQPNSGDSGNSKSSSTRITTETENREPNKVTHTSKVVQISNSYENQPISNQPTNNQPANNRPRQENNRPRTNPIERDEQIVQSGSCAQQKARKTPCTQSRGCSISPEEAGGLPADRYVPNVRRSVVQPANNNGNCKTYQKSHVGKPTGINLFDEVDEKVIMQISILRK
jgi:hypothetical protein